MEIKIQSSKVSGPVNVAGDFTIAIPNTAYVLEVSIIPAENLDDGSPNPFTSVKIRDTSIPAPPFNALSLLDDLDYNTVAWVHCTPTDD